jgi:hypothetical protein
MLYSAITADALPDLEVARDPYINYIKGVGESDKSSDSLKSMGLFFMYCLRKYPGNLHNLKELKETYQIDDIITRMVFSLEITKNYALIYQAAVPSIDQLVREMLTKELRADEKNKLKTDAQLQAEVSQIMLTKYAEVAKIISAEQAREEAVNQARGVRKTTKPVVETKQTPVSATASTTKKAPEPDLTPEEIEAELAELDKEYGNTSKDKSSTVLSTLFPKVPTHPLKQPEKSQDQDAEAKAKAKAKVDNKTVTRKKVGPLS